MQGSPVTYVLFFIKLSSRRVHVAGITEYPHGEWMKQVGRNVTDALDGFLLDVRYLILDRDSIFTAAYRDLLKNAGVKLVRLPPRSPNLNAYAERYVRTIKEGCLNRMIFFGERHVRHVVEQYVEHFNLERPHKGLGHRRPVEPAEAPCRDGPVVCRERLGGLLKSYQREAA